LAGVRRGFGGLRVDFVCFGRDLPVTGIGLGALRGVVGRLRVAMFSVRRAFF